MFIDIEYLLTLAKQAGMAIMDVYESDDFKIEMKKDKSPLTEADRMSHALIAAGLEEEYPDIPLISEEGKEIPLEERKEWEFYWLVDPLDGTKEFIKRNGEFTVNIALMKGEYPLLGVIYAPVKDEYYFSDGENAYKKRGDNDEKVIRVNVSKGGLVALQSRSHSSEEEEKFYSQYEIKSRKSKGSSLKFCLMAEGGADVYYRGGPTWEWDTAAGQAILEAAGGMVLTHAFERFHYNKDTLLNPGFVCFSGEGLIRK
jgi:3'(2'), 5'-bisphosphate nucleotidase